MARLNDLRRLAGPDPQHEVDDWNARHPVGTEVTVRKDAGDVVRSKTRSPAWVLSGHSAVILIDGISGCYLLGRVAPVAAEGRQ